MWEERKKFPAESMNVVVAPKIEEIRKAIYILLCTFPSFRANENANIK